MTQKRFNVGVIGAGMIGKVHAEHLAFRIPETILFTIADVNHVVAELAERLRVSKAVTDYHEILLTHPLMLSPSVHPRIPTPIICEAALAGKHIFCEKPISYDLKKIDEALATVSKTGVKFQVGFNRRFDPNFARVKKAVVEEHWRAPFIAYHQ